MRTSQLDSIRLSRLAACLIFLAGLPLVARQKSTACAADPPAPAAGDYLSQASSNPYLAPPDYPTDQLGKHLDRLLAKPQTIRERPGYREAILDTTARILSTGSGAGDSPLETALVARLNTLAELVRDGQTERLRELADLAETHCADQRHAVAEVAKLRRWECRVLYGGPVDADLAPELLGELKKYFESTLLASQHLRLASAAVGLINQIPDGEQAKKLYAAFGGLFARSTDRGLARYGEKIRGGSSEESWVGKSLEVEGQTVDGTPFDWAAYRGKVVLIDFWATWCGPCRAEVPHVLEAYQRYHDAGFEVVAISLDRDREALETFLADEQIPWTNLFDDSGEGRNPVAERYHIRAIPSTFLLGRDGKVIAQNLRGTALAERLAQLFAAERSAPLPEKQPD